MPPEAPNTFVYVSDTAHMMTIMERNTGLEWLIVITAAIAIIGGAVAGYFYPTWSQTYLQTCPPGQTRLVDAPPVDGYDDLGGLEGNGKFGDGGGTTPKQRIPGCDAALLSPTSAGSALLGGVVGGALWFASLVIVGFSRDELKGRRSFGETSADKAALAEAAWDWPPPPSEHVTVYGSSLYCWRDIACECGTLVITASIHPTSPAAQHVTCGGCQGDHVVRVDTIKFAQTRGRSEGVQNGVTGGDIWVLLQRWSARQVTLTDAAYNRGLGIASKARCTPTVCALSAGYTVMVATFAGLILATSSINVFVLLGLPLVGFIVGCAIGAGVGVVVARLLWAKACRLGFPPERVPNKPKFALRAYYTTNRIETALDLLARLAARKAKRAKWEATHGRAGDPTRPAQEAECDRPGSAG